ncbi:MAG: hypothetical protein J5756_01280 [Clostridia bacterium]|nr:hypothetical protein [Clostridia bacterium]
MRKVISSITALIIIAAIMFSAPARVAAVSNDYPKISFESERDIIYLPIGDSIELKINNPMVLPMSWQPMELSFANIEGHVAFFTLWRSTQSDVVDFTSAHKQKWPSNYDTDPMVEEDDCSDWYDKYEAYLDYDFSENDVYVTSEVSPYMPDYMYSAEIEAKSKGVADIKAAVWEHRCYWTSRGVQRIRTFLPCDVDDDGEVTVSDALLALRMYVLEDDLPEHISGEDIIEDPYLNVCWIRNPENPDFIGRLVASYACDEGEEYNELTMADVLAVLRRALGGG